MIVLFIDNLKFKYYEKTFIGICLFMLFYEHKG